MRIDTGPTRLRRLSVADLPAFLAYRSDPEVARYQSWEAMDVARATAFLKAMSEKTPLIRPGSWTQIAVADTTTDALLGDMGWHLSEDGREVELGITLAREAHGKGHATRALRSAVAEVFRLSDAERAVGYADLRNEPSRRLLRRAGFTSLGEQDYKGLREEAFEFPRPVASV